MSGNPCHDAEQTEGEVTHTAHVGLAETLPELNMSATVISWAVFPQELGEEGRGAAPRWPARCFNLLFVRFINITALLWAMGYFPLQCYVCALTAMTYSLFESPRKCKANREGLLSHEGENSTTYFGLTLSPL